MRVLAIGDVFAKAGLEALERWLPGLREQHEPSYTIVNVENLHQGHGVEKRALERVFELGADCATSGNHVWAHKGAEKLLEVEHRLLRPANYPEPCPGRGVAVGVTPEGARLGIVNLIGRVFMGPVDDPFAVADEILVELRDEAEVIVVDFHAEATSEKLAMASHLDGRVAAVWGTHTHVQTADARVLPSGTAFISDLGMTGPYDSIIGKERAPILERFKSGRPVRAQAASGGLGLRGALFTIDEASGRASAVERISLGEGGR